MTDLARPLSRDDRAFVEVLERGKAIGRAKLQRLQWQSAIAGSDTMLIWLGKNGLGQRDKMALRSGGASGDRSGDRRRTRHVE